MPGPNLPPMTSLKKTWKFIWELNPQNKNFITSRLSGYILTAQAFASTVKSLVSVGKSLLNGNGWEESISDVLSDTALTNQLLLSYVSQMAKSVSLPDDEIELDYSEFMSYPIPKKLKRNDIVVKYYDDSNDTVYNFHKEWLEKIVPTVKSDVKTFSMNNFNACLPASYTAYENELDFAEYVAYRKATSVAGSINDKISSIASAVVGSTLSTVANSLFTMTGLDNVSSDIFMDFKSKQTYPMIFPVKISRSEADKSGEDLSEVIVTYIRLPVLNLKKPLSGINGRDSNNYGL